MKKVILMLCVCASLTSQAQKTDSLTLPVLNGRVGIQEVVPVDSASAKNLYSRAKIFFTQSFKSAKDVIQLDDPENNIIIGKGYSSIVFQNFIATANMPIKFTIKIETQAHKYRYTIDNVYVVGDVDFNAEMYWKAPKMNKNLRKALGEEIYNLANMIKKGMTQPVSDKW